MDSLAVSKAESKGFLWGFFSGNFSRFTGPGRTPSMFLSCTPAYGTHRALIPPAPGAGRRSVDRRFRLRGISRLRLVVLDPGDRPLRPVVGRSPLEYQPYPATIQLSPQPGFVPLDGDRPRSLVVMPQAAKPLILGEREGAGDGTRWTTTNSSVRDTRVRSRNRPPAHRHHT